MKRANLHAIVYAAVLGLACALALTAVDAFTAAKKAANAEAEEIRTIMGVLGVPFDGAASSAELLAVYETEVREEERGGVSLHVYDHPEAGTIRAVPFTGSGLWGPVEGLLALEDDLRTIYAISFYRHEETPGLGGEISSDAFRDQFRGKVIVDASGTPGIRVVGDGADEANEVDAISGATMTSDRVEEMLNGIIERIASGGVIGGE